MEDVLQQLQENSVQVVLPLELPTDDQLVEVEEALLISLPMELREFMLLTGDVIYGSIEPVTGADPQSHTFLPEVAANAWSEGVPREYIPICYTDGQYYVISEEGEVLLWSLEDNAATDDWSSIWHWAKDVWLES
ncbi:MAG: SMI1/KNR4 family protein [Pontibacterium sp.]